MRRWGFAALLVIGILTLLLRPPALLGQAGGPFIRATCSQINSPTTGASVCFNSTRGELQVWTGSAWIAISGASNSIANGVLFVTATGVTTNTNFQFTGTAQTVMDGDETAPGLRRVAAVNTGMYLHPQGALFTAAGVQLGGFVNGALWSADVSGQGLRLHGGAPNNGILSLQGRDASTIRYDGEQIEVVFGSGNNANFALVHRNQSSTDGVRLEVRNAADTDGVSMRYLNNDTPLITVAGSLVANRNLTVRPKNATSIPWIVQGASSQSADLQQWMQSDGTLLGAFTSAGALQIGATLTLTNGAWGVPRITASASAPGADGAKFEVVCGTNAGTAKLVMYAGTSATSVTVVDNVGSGVTGC